MCFRSSILLRSGPSDGSGPIRRKRRPRATGVATTQSASVIGISHNARNFFAASNHYDFAPRREGQLGEEESNRDDIRVVFRHAVGKNVRTLWRFWC